MNYTLTFFDTYYQDIIWSKTDFENTTGASMEIEHNVKNHLVWFAFEQTAYKIAKEIGLEI
ncbi:MAG: hypothetical protein GKR88_01530 [Flavobacteriaceae bacterium]|nr:MAG: hypothetical protein GKR88_01530 [Flavobacteriaceae bacterium]